MARSCGSGIWQALLTRIVMAPRVAGCVYPDTFVFFAVKKHCNGICSIVGIEFPEVNTLRMGVPDPADFKL